jgi:hypothetical protein
MTPNAEIQPNPKVVKDFESMLAQIKEAQKVQAGCC